MLLLFTDDSLYVDVDDLSTESFQAAALALLTFDGAITAAVAAASSSVFAQQQFEGYGLASVQPPAVVSGGLLSFSGAAAAGPPPFSADVEAAVANQVTGTLTAATSAFEVYGTEGDYESSGTADAAAFLPTAAALMLFQSSAAASVPSFGSEADADEVFSFSGSAAVATVAVTGLLDRESLPIDMSGSIGLVTFSPTALLEERFTGFATVSSDAFVGAAEAEEVFTGPAVAVLSSVTVSAELDTDSDTYITGSAHVHIRRFIGLGLGDTPVHRTYYIYYTLLRPFQRQTITRKLKRPLWWWQYRRRRSTDPL